ncbi:MAG: response regulator [Deltaproteobacteria bacterium]|nr:response regulator [Deltaproteobacteria bacterium]
METTYANEKVREETGTLILVVEDDEGLNNLISKTLERSGFQTISALQGTTAIEQIMSHDSVMIVLDYQLTDMTGKQLIEQLLEMGKVVPFIMVTGQGDERTAVEMMKLGARDYLVKDTGFMDQLPRVVSRALENVNVETKLAHAEEELRHSQERFRQMSELSPFPIWFLTANEQTEYMNPRFTKVFGYTADDLPNITQWFEQAFPKPDEREKVKLSWGKDRSTLNDLDSVKHEFNVISKDGSTKTATMRLLKMEDQTLYLVFHDITETKKADQLIRDQYDEIEVHAYELESSNTELKQAQEKLTTANRELHTTLDELRSSHDQLLQSAKLAAIGELVSGVAHELNNPLSAVAMHTELLGSKVSDEDAMKHIDTISGQTERAISIVKNLLSFSRKQEPRRDLVSINQAVESSLSLRSYDLNLDNIEITLELDRNNPKTLADFRQLQQVFLNLINNAAQSMSEAHGRGRLVIESYTVGDMVRVSFSDDGAGIPEGKKERIFEPFFTTKDVGKGTGLGLSICYGIIEEHGGCILTEDTDGGGATFVVELPETLETFDCPL